MTTAILENEFYKSIYHTGALIAIVSILSIISYTLIKNIHAGAIDNDTEKLKRRVIYIATICVIIFSAKIWVQGFTHVFYGLSLVSAGLVVTNKESIMNLVGWGIISWRGLFSEGDFVEIGDYKGVVCELGMLYFKILEANSLMHSRSTGKYIKIPNGVIINSVIKRYSLNRHIIENQISWLSPIDSHVFDMKERILDIVTDTLSSYGLGNEAGKKTKKTDKWVQQYVYQPPHISIHFNGDKPEYLKVCLYYHCVTKDKPFIEQAIIASIIQECPQLVSGLCNDISAMTVGL